MIFNLHYDDCIARPFFGTWSWDKLVQEMGLIQMDNAVVFLWAVFRSKGTAYLKLCLRTNCKFSEKYFGIQFFYQQSDMIIKLRTAGWEARMLPLCCTRPHVKALSDGSAYPKWTIRFIGLSWKMFCCSKCSIHLRRVLPPMKEPNVSSR